MTLRPCLALVGLLLIAVTVAACGESDAEKAQTQVCDARADLTKRIDNLAGLTLANATVDGVKEDLDGIQKDLNEMKDAQGDLNDERKKEVESATRDFTSELDAIKGDLGSDLSLSGAGAKLQTAADQLTSSYKQAFSKVDCD